jgi:hypothetical protein
MLVVRKDYWILRIGCVSSKLDELCRTISSVFGFEFICHETRKLWLTVSKFMILLLVTLRSNVAINSHLPPSKLYPLPDERTAIGRRPK